MVVVVFTKETKPFLTTYEPEWSHICKKCGEKSGNASYHINFDDEKFFEGKKFITIEQLLFFDSDNKLVCNYQPAEHLYNIVSGDCFCVRFYDS